MDAFEEKIMHKDVMPWLYTETGKYTKNLNSYEQYPNRMIVEFMADEVNEHAATVSAHREAVLAKKLAIQREEEQKQIDKQRRREERAAKRKAVEIAALRETVEKEFIAKGVGVEEILKCPLVEADGYGTKETPIVGMLGGWLGQIMIVFNCLAKNYKGLDRDRKSGSSKGTPRSHKSGKSSNIDKNESRKIINDYVIQEFIYNFIGEKLQAEVLLMNVDWRFEDLLKKLARAKPILLNQNWGQLKPIKHDELRNIIRTHMADPVLELIRDNQKELGMDPDVFDMVFEGFWDLYCHYPKIDDLKQAQLKAWSNRFVLQTDPENPAPLEGEAEVTSPTKAEDLKSEKDLALASDLASEKPEEEVQANKFKLDAIVRIRIPKKQPDAEYSEGGGTLLEPEEPVD
jgi:hypothetical protein